MIIRSLWIALFLSAFVAAKERAIKVQECQYTATVKYTDSFLGTTCEKNNDCTAFQKKVCSFVKKPLATLLAPSNVCEAKVTDDFSQVGTRKVTITIRLFEDTEEGGLQFDVRHSTFSAALRQALLYLHNTPHESVVIESAECKRTDPPDNTLKAPEKPADFEGRLVVTVTGKVYQDDKAVDVFEGKKCEIEKQLFTLDTSSDLVDIMYKYSPRNITIETFPKAAGETITLKLFYPNTFFATTGINHTQEFTNALKWGLSNPVSKKQYYLQFENSAPAPPEPGQPAGAQAAPGQPAPTQGVTAVVEAKPAITEPRTIPLVYTATVQDDGDLSGKKCEGGPDDACAAYKQKLCQMAQTPLYCGRVPRGYQTCSVETPTPRQPNVGLDAKITLRIQDRPVGAYPITLAHPESCPTFAALYKMKLSQKAKNPKISIKAFEPPLKPVSLTSDKVDFEITGTLYKDKAAVTTATLVPGAEEKIKAALLKLKLVEPMLDTFYHSAPIVEKFALDTKLADKVTVSMTISYLKTVFEENGIDPGCDLNDMLQWALQTTKLKKGYYFGDDTTVQNSVAKERESIFRFKATVHDSGTFKGAECNSMKDMCTEYKHQLCQFIRKPLLPLEMSPKDFCTVEILSDRTEDNKLEVGVSLKLNTTHPNLSFDVRCPTFGGVLSQSFALLHNTPKAGLNIKEILSIHDPPEIPKNAVVGDDELVVFKITGTLYENGNPVNAANLDLNDKCALREKLLGVELNGDLLNTMYTYNDKRIVEIAKETDASTVTIQIKYQKKYFKDTGISPGCDFKENLLKGFQHPVSPGQFYFDDKATVIEVQNSKSKWPLNQLTSTPYTKITVKDGGKLNGHECPGDDDACVQYKKELCKLIRKPLLCTRLRNRPGVCEVTTLTRHPSKGQMEASLNLNLKIINDQYSDIFTISSGNEESFKNLHLLTLKTLYDSPKVIYKPTPVKYPQVTNPVVYQVIGKLFLGEKPITKETDPDNIFEAKYQLANLDMPAQLLQTLYKYNQKRKVAFTEFLDGTTAGQVTFTVSYPKAFFENNAIDPTKDIAEMLKWGFINAKSSGYHLGTDTTVTKQ